jgi:hypothetical protein
MGPGRLRGRGKIHASEQDHADDFNAVKTLGRRTGSTRTADQSALAVFWEGNASVHWNQAANQMARANHVSLSDSAEARADGNHARVWGGMHYPSTVVSSDAVGEAIARYVNRPAMQRLRER